MREHNVEEMKKDENLETQETVVEETDKTVFTGF